MTLRELGERMDACELMEWNAYFLTQDSKEVERLNKEIINDKDAEFHQTQLRSLFTSITHKKKSNGSKNK